MRVYRRGLWLALPSSMLGLALGVAAHATAATTPAQNADPPTASDTPEVAEVVVTAQKRVERL